MNKDNKYVSLPQDLINILEGLRTQKSTISLSIYDVDRYIVRLPQNYMLTIDQQILK